MITLKIKNFQEYRSRTMKINFPFFYLMPVLVISDLAATNEGLKSNVHASSNRRFLWKSKFPNRVQNRDKATLSSPQRLSHIHRPNIVLILTDDQDIELGSLNFMFETGRLLKEGGAEFRHAYTTTPMCCPSRSSMLTGLYVHNHNVYTNNDNCSNFQWQIEHETKSFATYLSNAGYHTGYFGKYLNKYNGSYIPPGWKEWGGLIMNSKYYNYSINFNGKRIGHGDDYRKDYYTDLVANDSINFLKQWRSSKLHKPALLVMSFPAPHGPEDSAPQFSNMFLNVTSHHTPSYDYAPNPDKQWILQVTSRMLPIHKHFTDILMTKRLQTLQSVDFAVKRVYEQLEESGQLENTYIIYTSDHGYHLGQFGLIKGKSFPFEFDVRVPFLVRGPGIEPGSVINEIALNIDVAPTILDIAGLSIPAHMDGRSLVKLFNKRKKSSRKYLINWPDTFLIESSGRRDASFTGIHHVLELNNISSTYDAQNLSNTISVTPGVFFSSTSSSENSNNCAESGKSKSVNCTFFFNSNHTNTLSKAERLSLECQQPEFASPCQIGQKWHCILRDNRWRKHKCKNSSPYDSTTLSNLHKCTCITEDGIVYMRFQTSDNQTSARRFEGAQSTTVHYLKPNKPSEELVNELANSWRMMKRQRRQILRDNTHINSSIENESVARTIAILDVIDGQIIELPVSSNETSNTTACMVSLNGSVQCPPDVYRNPHLWKTSQQSIAVQRRKLQNQIEALKKIQRHLEDMQLNSVNTRMNIDSKYQEQTRRISLNTQTYPSNSGNNISKTESFNTHKHRHHHDSSESIKNGPVLMEQMKLESERSIPDTCYCIPHNIQQITTEEVLKEQKRRVQEQRLKKQQRKFKKRAKLGKMCSLEKMNCFNHDNEHWKTPPLWTEGPFCFCMNANNNTYNCIRTINATHNFLYCEFVTGFMTYYNLRIDPFQQWNRYNNLSKNEKSWLRDTLTHLIKCKGHKDCGPIEDSQESDVHNKRGRLHHDGESR